MSDIIGYAVIIFFIGTFSYGLILQIKETIYIIKSKSTKNKKVLLGNIISSVSYACFLIAYIFNVLISLQVINNLIITSENTSFFCSIFLITLLISNYFIIPKKVL